MPQRRIVVVIDIDDYDHDIVRQEDKQMAYYQLKREQGKQIDTDTDTDITATVSDALNKFLDGSDAVWDIKTQVII